MSLICHGFMKSIWSLKAAAFLAYFIGDRISNGEPENTVLILYIVIFTVLVGKLKYVII